MTREGKFKHKIFNEEYLIVDKIENETHTLFIGKIIEADVYVDKEAMSYQYYQEHKNELLIN